MKCVIVAGGLGSRLSEETDYRPKPMVEIGGRPILWHIMKIYSHYGINDFIICLGYKGYVIKEYFSNYYLHTSDVSFDLRENKIDIHRSTVEPWRVTLIDTGVETMTGGRMRRVAEYIGTDDFCFTYGDGVANVDIAALIDFHRRSGKWATVTAVQPVGRFGQLSLDGDVVTNVVEKPSGDGTWINGGFFVLSPKVLDLISDDSVAWETAPLSALSERGQLASFRHKGFWQPMDTLREKRLLEDLWQTGRPPWKIWD
jgi:glucose-1-phosphate cytidylyltransferase